MTLCCILVNTRRQLSPASMCRHVHTYDRETVTGGLYSLANACSAHVAAYVVASMLASVSYPGKKRLNNSRAFIKQALDITTSCKWQQQKFRINHTRSVHLEFSGSGSIASANVTSNTSTSATAYQSQLYSRRIRCSIQGGHTLACAKCRSHTWQTESSSSQMSQESSASVLDIPAAQGCSVSCDQAQHLQQRHACVAHRWPC